MDYLQHLEKILESKYRLVAIETYDTDRVHDLFVQLSRFSNKAYYVATPDDGMHRIGASHIQIPRTSTPKEQLEHINKNKHYGLYILRDYSDVIQEKGNIELLKEIGTSRDPKCVVILSEYVDLPRELKPYTMRSKHQMKNVV